MPNNHTKVQPAVPTPAGELAGTKSNRNESRLRNAYPDSPIYSGDLTDEERLRYFQENVLNGEVDDRGAGVVGKYNRDFPNAPDVSTVETGGEGKPASPYGPTVASPGVGSANPADLPTLDAESVPQSAGNASVGGAATGTENPAVTSRKIASQTVETLGSYMAKSRLVD